MLTFALVLVLSYLIGSISVGRYVVKKARCLNIGKVGSGYPDTENIYYNVSKPLGTLVALINFAKMYAWMLLLNYFLTKFGEKYHIDFMANVNTMFFWGFAFVIGNCLPVLNKFKGGRGILTYAAFVTWFHPYIMLQIGVLNLYIIIAHKQYRAAQYLTVLLPPMLGLLWSTFFKYFFVNSSFASYYADTSFPTRLLLAGFFMGVLNLILSKRLGEI